MSDIVIAAGSGKPIPNIIGRKFKLRKPYQGYSEVKVAEAVGRNAFGIPLYGCHVEGYNNPHKPSEPITVDFAADEFLWEQGEAYLLQFERGLEWIKTVLGESSPPEKGDLP